VNTREKKPYIAIIGGGIAGLATAYYLNTCGMECVVYEKGSEVGGRFSTREFEGAYINRGALMFCPASNPCFSEIVGALGITYEHIDMSTFALQVGDRLIPLDHWSLLKSGLFSFSDFLKWLRLKKLLRSLSFDFTTPDERLLEWHELSLLEFCQKVMKLSDALIDYLIQPFSSFAYVDPDELSADYGLFLLSYSITPCATFKKGMGEVALNIKESLPGAVKLNWRVRKVTYEAYRGFMIVREGGQSESEGPYDYCVFATGRRNVKNLMSEVNFEVFGSKTRGLIFETVAPRYRPFELLIFPKRGNTHGVHGGEIRHLADGRSVCGMFLHRTNGDPGAVFDSYNIIERVGWSPAISVTQPGSGLRDVTTNVPHAFVVGDFFRFPSLESCAYTAKKVAGLIGEVHAAVG